MILQQRNRVPAFGLADMSREMDRLMHALWTDGGVTGGTDGAPVAGPAGVAAGRWGLPAEIIETADEIRIDIEAPGFREEDLEVTLEHQVLTVSGEKRMQRDENVRDSDYRLLERRYGRFSRSFGVPPTVRADRCEASYANGVLTLRLPKVEEAKPRRIPIGGSGEGRNLESGAA